MGNTKAVDTLVLPDAIQQIVNLKTESAELRTEMTLLLETAVKLNATLGGSTPATFAKNAKASTDATLKLIENSNKQVELINKKAAAEEVAYNKYLQLLSKQQAERDKADAKEIAAAEKKAAKLAAIQAESARKADIQFPVSTPAYNPITSEPDNPSVRYEPIITGEENMQIAMAKSSETIAAETLQMAEQKEVLDSLSGSYRANLELLLALQVERAENSAALKALNAEDAASSERLVFLTAEQLRLKVAIQQTNLTLSQQTKQMLAEDTSGAQMQARLDELRVAIGNLSEAELANIEIGGVWLAEAEKLDIAIKQLRGSTGDATKNVGAYTTATAIADKVSAQFVRQLVRMAAQFLLITIAFGAITWLYDYIKNLDIFTGRLDQATQNLKALNEVQKNSATEAGQMVGKYRILSDTIKDLSVSYEDRLKAATELKKLFPEELEHSTAQAIANGTESASLDKLTDSVVKLAKARAAAAEIEKVSGEIIQLQIQRDNVNIQKAKDIQDAQTKTSGRIGFGGVAFTQAGQAAGAKLRADKSNADIAAQIKVKEQTIKYLEQYGGLQKEAEAIESKSTLNPKSPKVKDTANTDLLEFNRIKLEQVKKQAKLILDNEEQSYDTRKVALDVYIKASNDLVKNGEDIALADANLRKQQRLNILEKFKNDSIDIEQERVIETNKLQKSLSESLKKQLEDLLKLDDTLAKTAIQQQSDIKDSVLAGIEDSKDAQLRSLDDKYTRGKIKEKDYQREIKQIQDRANIENLAAIEAFEGQKLEILQGQENADILASRALGGNDDDAAKIRANSGVGAQTKTFNTASRNVQNAIGKQGLDDAQTAAAKKKAAEEAALAFAQQTEKSIEDLINKGYENQISKLEQIGKQIEENSRIEKAAIDRSLDTQSNKARRQADLDAQTASQQKALQERINAEKKKQAIANKAEGITEIIINTGVAISKVLGQTGIFGIALAPIVAALGAVQLAAAIAAPIPSFFRGTGLGSHKGGLARVGELGPELITEPNKKPYYSPGTATILDLPYGTKVSPHEMLPKTPAWTSVRSDNSDVVAAVNENTRAVRDSKKRGNTRASGWMREMRNGNAWDSYSQNHFK